VLYGAGRLAQRRQEFESYLGVSRVYFTSSGKTALYLALQALRRLGRGTEVVVPAYTCFSVPSAIVKAGLRVVPCDIDPNSYDFDYEQLERALNPNTLCIIATHLFGIPADIAKIRDVAARRGVYVIEDAAQGLGEVHHGKHLGTSGDLGIYSLGRGKHLTCGSGGMVVTSHPRIAQELSLLYEMLPEPPLGETLKEWLVVALMQLFIRPWLYWVPAHIPLLKLGHTEFDPNFVPQKLSAMKAGLLEGWREQLERGNAVRRRNVETITRKVRDRVSARHSMPLLRWPVLCHSQAERQRIWEAGRRLGVAKMYPTGIHMISHLEGPHIPEAYPGATLVAERLLTLPTHHLLSNDELKALAALVNEELRPGDTCERKTELASMPSRSQPV
jgi:dTDP-4-amino-4,6-dideoxygalactose transaminase